MKILRMLLKILAQSLYGVVILYFFLAWVIIPCVGPWAIKDQGSKLLKHPVKVRSLTFNPFLWRLTLQGLEIQNPQNSDLVFLERLSIKVSFLDLLKKIYHVEAVELDGLNIHVSLLENGKVDLLDLVPASSPQAAPESTHTVKPEKTSPLPLILVDDIRIQNSCIKFDDHSVQPVFQTVLSEIRITVQHFSTQPDGITAVTFKGLLDNKGDVIASAQLKPFAKALDLDMNFELDHYVLKITSPYVGKYTGHALRDGKLDFKTAYRISQNKLTASHNLLIQRFAFGEKVPSKDALNLPFGLAVALLEDPQGRIDISLPVSGDISDPKFKYGPIFWGTVRNFFTKLITKPFSVLGSLLGSESGTEELGSVKFLPGKSELSPEELKKLTHLAKTLRDRPRLRLEINGGYDLTVDWKAIKEESFLKEYNVLRKESSRPEYWVLQTIYQRHYGIRSLWKLTSKFKIPHGYDYEKLNVEIRRELEEEAFPDKKVLHDLAAARAKVIYDTILKDLLDPRRVNVGQDQEVQASLGFVPLNFTLTVFDQAKDESAADPESSVDQATVPEGKK